MKIRLGKILDIQEEMCGIRWKPIKTVGYQPKVDVGWIGDAMCKSMFNGTYEWQIQDWFTEEYWEDED